MSMSNTERVKLREKLTEWETFPKHDPGARKSGGRPGPRAVTFLAFNLVDVERAFRPKTKDSILEHLD